MGWWGSGNLENDGSSDFLLEVSEKHFERLEALLKIERATQYDEDEYYEFFCTIEIICALHDKNLIYWAPKQREFRKHYRSFLKKLYRYESCDKERKLAIKSSFARLDKVIQDIHKEREQNQVVQIDEETLRNDPRYKDIVDIFSVLDKPEASDENE